MSIPSTNEIRTKKRKDIFMKMDFLSKFPPSILLISLLGLSGCEYSFTKLDSDGNAIYASSKTWSCLLDNNTGLTWEKKDVGDALRSQNWTYMNTSVLNSDDPTLVADNGACIDSEVDGDGIFCDTESYVAAVNASEYCGASDWRIPTLYEVSGLVRCNKGTILEINGTVFCNEESVVPVIDKFYFPFTKSAYYWPTWDEDEEDDLFRVQFGLIGLPESAQLSDANHVRLVRGGQ